ncbi:hypothetical protein [Anaeromassilibacillus sp. SJQ-1]
MEESGAADLPEELPMETQNALEGTRYPWDGLAGVDSNYTGIPLL